MLGLLQRNVVQTSEFLPVHKLQQAIMTSAQHLDQPVLPEGVKAGGLGYSCMELDIVHGIW